MRKAHLIGIGLALGLAAPALADVKQGVDAWQRGDYATAIKEWRPLAISGDADAQFNLAQAYKLGRGVPTDLKQAEMWYKKAADKGHVQAADNYGLVLFQNGDRKGALPWLEKSATRGEPRAQYVLGTALFNGDIADKDWVRAYALMTRASSAGLPQASNTLAQMDQYIPLVQRQQGIGPVQPPSPRHRDCGQHGQERDDDEGVERELLAPTLASFDDRLDASGGGVVEQGHPANLLDVGYGSVTYETVT